MDKEFKEQYNLQQYGAGTAVNEAIRKYQEKYAVGNNFVNMVLITVTFEEGEIYVTVAG